MLKLSKTSKTFLLLLLFARVAVEDQIEAVAFLSVLGETIVDALHAAQGFLSLLVVLFMVVLILHLLLWEANFKHDVAGLLVLVVEAAVHVLRATVHLLLLMFRVSFWGVIVWWVAAEEHLSVAASPGLSILNNDLILPKSRTTNLNSS